MSAPSPVVANTDAALVPKSALPFQFLPQPIVAGLTQPQRDALSFSVRTFKVVTARVQTFQTGATSGGSVKFAGSTYAWTSHWSTFGGVGTINLSTANQFKTDVQFKLRDETTGEDAFIARSLPFAMTLSIDPGDTIEIYFVCGGLDRFYAPGDFALKAWTPFAARSMNTGQIVPFSPAPAFLRPQASPIGPIITLTFGLLFLLLGFVVDSQTLILLSTIACLIGAIIIAVQVTTLNSYKRDLKLAIEQKAAASR